jgi:hypothetical protein
LLSECKRVAGTIYMKDHLPANAMDRVMLHLLDVIGNVPFGGMVSADYLDLAEWKELAVLTGFQMSPFQTGEYRSGIEALIGPNRLDFISRFDPLAGAKGE